LEHERNKRKRKVGCYWEHLGEHIDGNSMATHWNKKKEKKRKKCDVAIGNILDNTLMRTLWELNG
jgi:hypothetical protein